MLTWWCLLKRNKGKHLFVQLFSLPQRSSSISFAKSIKSLRYLHSLWSPPPPNIVHIGVDYQAREKAKKRQGSDVQALASERWLLAVLPLLLVVAATGQRQGVALVEGASTTPPHIHSNDVHGHAARLQVVNSQVCHDAWPYLGLCRRRRRR